MTLSPSTEQREALITWLDERAENAAAIAQLKAGADRQGWLEDERHYRAAAAALRALPREVPPREPTPRMLESALRQVCAAILEEPDEKAYSFKRLRLIISAANDAWLAEASLPRERKDDTR